LAIGSIPTDLGYYRSCWLLPLVLMLLAIAGVAGVLLSELDAAGHTDALEMLLLLSSDAIVADVELDQRPHIFDGISDSSRT
jgi:hypothetical protein